jgi:hypothetical protein
MRYQRGEAHQCWFAALQHAPGNAAQQLEPLRFAALSAFSAADTALLQAQISLSLLARGEAA